MAWNYPPYYGFYPPSLPGANGGELASQAARSSTPPSSVPGIPSPSAGGNESSRPRQYTYSLKIINPKRTSQFTVEKFRHSDRFLTPSDLKQCILSEVATVPDNFDVGYYKGRGSAKVWIKSDEDLKCMYESHSSDYEIVLWCQGQEHDQAKSSGSGRKRKVNDDSSKTPSKRQVIREEVDEIFADLKEKHGSTYTAAQLRLWANMLQVGTHKDYEEPPKVPMFGVGSKTTKGSGTTNLCEALAGVAEGFMRALKSPVQSAPSTNSPLSTDSLLTANSPLSTNSPPRTPLSLNEMGVSPGKCAVLRSQYINQLKQLHQLLELTAITKTEYEEQKASILAKMQKL